MQAHSRGSARRSVPVLRSVGLIVLGAVLGTVWFLLTPTTYTGETRVAVGQANLSAAQVPGYAVASETLASNYARYVQDTVAARAKLDRSGAVKHVTASPIPSSSVIRIDVEATNRASAIAGANLAAKNLLATIGTASDTAASAKAAFTKAYVAYLEAKTTAEVETKAASTLLGQAGRADPSYQAALDTALQAQAEAQILNLQQLALATSYQTAYKNADAESAVTIVRQASDASSDTAANAQKTIGIGVLVGIAAAVALEFFRRRRLADGDDGVDPARS